MAIFVYYSRCGQAGRHAHLLRSGHAVRLRRRVKYEMPIDAITAPVCLAGLKFGMWGSARVPAGSRLGPVEQRLDVEDVGDLCRGSEGGGRSAAGRDGGTVAVRRVDPRSEVRDEAVMEEGSSVHTNQAAEGDVTDYFLLVLTLSAVFIVPEH